MKKDKYVRPRSRGRRTFIGERRVSPLAAARAGYAAKNDGFSALVYAARISDARGQSTFADQQMSRMFDAASKTRPCLDCMHPECVAVGNLMMTAYEMIAQHERTLVTK
jgi:hypothetical protein